MNEKLKTLALELYELKNCGSPLHEGRAKEVLSEMDEIYYQMYPQYAPEKPLEAHTEEKIKNTSHPTRNE